MPKLTTTPLLLLLVLLLHSASALKCYDCMSKALPSCLNAANSKEFDMTDCAPDEKFCSVLKMRDSQGKLVVGRQCAVGPDEGENLFKLITPLISGELKMEAFITCDTEGCNAEKRQSGETKGSASTLSPLASTCAAFISLTVVMAALLH